MIYFDSDTIYMMMSIDDTNLDRDNGLDFNESLITGNYHLPGGPHDDKS